MRQISNAEKLNKAKKIKSMERESNITLVSTTVAIISFFVLFYAQGFIATNFVKAQTFLLVVSICYAAAAVVVTAIAIIKKEKWLWEYILFGALMAIGYYFMKNPGVSGLTLIYPADEIGMQSGPMIDTVANILSARNIKYALWAINLLYCVLSIALHSVRYNKIKNTKAAKN